MCAKPAVADRRQSIIDAARNLFVARPYDRITMSEIAKNAGVAYGLIAHHFENKRGLYRDSYSGSFVALLRGALGADTKHQEAVERLRWLGAQRILLVLAVTDPIAPVLRAAMQGWGISMR